MSMKSIALVFVLLASSLMMKAQVVYYTADNSNLYALLDELANVQIIKVNSMVQPYDRQFIANALTTALDSSHQLNARQIKAVEFYLKDFGKELHRDKAFDRRRDLFYYKDSLFSITTNPILSSKFSLNDNGFGYQRRNGGEVFGYLGRHLGFYSRLHDNYQLRDYNTESKLTQAVGGNYKAITDSSLEFSQMKGGVTISNEWGTLALVKDHFTWGNNYHGSNIVSNRAPSFAQIRLHVHPTNWLDFHYFHGWLSSEVEDSTRSYVAGVRNRRVLAPKYMAANLLTITPLKGLKLSAGNSIIYSDRFQPAFLIPIFFYKSIDHTIYYGTGNFGGQNAQFFADISSRQIKNVHLFTTLFVDEVSFSRMYDKDSHSNFFSFKFGGTWSNIAGTNFTIRSEYTRTNPVTYRHFVSTTTYASNGYILGHHLGDNAQEIATTVRFAPFARSQFEWNCTVAQKGDNYPYTGTNGSGLGLPTLDNITWNKFYTSIYGNYEFINDVNFFAQVEYSNYEGTLTEKYTPYYYSGNQLTVSTGFTLTY